MFNVKIKSVKGMSTIGKLLVELAQAIETEESRDAMGSSVVTKKVVTKNLNATDTREASKMAYNGRNYPEGVTRVRKFEWADILDGDRIKALKKGQECSFTLRETHPKAPLNRLQSAVINKANKLIGRDKFTTSGDGKGKVTLTRL